MKFPSVITSSVIVMIIFTFSSIRFTKCQFQLTNSAYVEKHLMCALDVAPCDYVGQQIKQALPKVIGQNCATCNAREAVFASRMATFVQRNYPSVWAQLVQKYSNYGK